MNNKTDDFLERIQNATEENSHALTDQLYGLVWREKRFDLLEQLLFSGNENTKYSALFVLEECACLKEAKSIRASVMQLMNGGFAEQLAFAIYCSDTKLVDEEILGHIVELFDSNTLVLRDQACKYACLIDLDGLNQLGAKIYKKAEYEFANHVKFDDWKPSRNRVYRAFRLVLLIRAGCNLGQIEHVNTLEDSFTLDELFNFTLVYKAFKADISRAVIGI